MDLARLLAAWRDTHDEALEPLIEKAGAEAAAGRTLAGKGAAREAAWYQLVTDPDPAVVGVLLAGPAPGVAAFRARVAALQRRAPDPRITNAFAQLAPHYPDTKYQPFHRELGALLARAPTVAVRHVVQTFGGNIHAQHYHAGARAYATMTRTAAPAELLGTPDRSLDRLWARHREAPDDLAHRAVLADALQAAGDPRGELIALQLAPETPASRKRIAALLDDHRATWLGKLPWTKITPPPFECGFPVAIRVLNELAIVPTADAPEWLTIDELDITNAYEEDLAPILRAVPRVKYLVTSGRALPSLQRSGPWPQLRAVEANQAEWWPKPGVMPRLAMLGGMFGTGWQAKTKRLGIARLVHTRVELADIGKLAATEVPFELGITTGHCAIRNIGWSILVRGKAADVARCGDEIGGNRADAGAKILNTLAAAGITSMRVHGPKLDAAVAKLAKRGIEITAGAPFQFARV